MEEKIRKRKQRENKNPLIYNQHQDYDTFKTNKNSKKKARNFLNWKTPSLPIIDKMNFI